MNNQYDKMTWSFFEIWNNSLLIQNDRELTKRNYIWASELGGSYIDRYLKMQGVKQTNPPNERSLRKFQAGNIWEWIIVFTLKRAGILQETQEYLKHQYPGMLEVTGKLDLLAGGKPDWERATASVKELELPPMLENASLQIVEQLKVKYGNELKTIVLEVKSVASMMFDRYESTKKPNPGHAMQLFHYLKSKGMDEGHIVYISKDDCRMIEIPVHLASPYEHAYKTDIEAMTKIMASGIEPEKELEVIFNEDNGRFSKNWKVEYSGYLTQLYGYEEPHIYADKWAPKVSQWNRVLKRVVEGANMTALNLTVIDEIKAQFPNYDELIEKAKLVKPTDEEEENE